MEQNSSPQGPAHSLVVHIRLIFVFTPQFRNSLWINKFEDALLSVHPLDVSGTRVLILQKLQQKLPEVGGVTCGEHMIHWLSTLRSWKTQKNSQIQRLVQIIIIIGEACLGPVCFYFILYIIQKHPKEIHSADLIQHFLFHLLKTAYMTQCKTDLPTLINH